MKMKGRCWRNTTYYNTHEPLELCESEGSQNTLLFKMTQNLSVNPFKLHATVDLQLVFISVSVLSAAV